MDQGDIPNLLSRLGSNEDATRKMAVFKLQSSINDPSFADVFISSGGLAALRQLIMKASGNTLAYSLQSLSRLLEVDMGWEIFESQGGGELVERLVELIVTHPLVNILRGAMSILVAVVSHSQAGKGDVGAATGAFGFRALKPAVAVYPQFFELVVSQLNSADHALCGNALMLLNALMRDAITNGSDIKDGNSRSTGTIEEWPKFIKRLQDLGVIKTVYVLMQSSALQDLAHPLLEFQALSKLLLRKWREVKVDLERPEHRRALKSLHLASAPDRKVSHSLLLEQSVQPSKKEGKKHNPEKWRRLGFATESPAWEFECTGFLGIMDLADYVRKHESDFQKLLLEQSSKPLHERCPIARASVAVTAILYEHFHVEKSDAEDARNYLVLDGMKNYDKIYRPLLLQWSKIHTGGLLAFFRLWKSMNAEQDDFDKVADLVRILIGKVVGRAGRTKDVQEVEAELAEFEYSKLRELQMELLQSIFEDQWGSHLAQVKDELKHEALQFVREQRIRCLLTGSWFLRPAKGADDSERGGYWRCARLSSNRRYLHYSDFATKGEVVPMLDQLAEKIDLSTISSVVSNVSAFEDETSSNASVSTLKHLPRHKPINTKISINAYESRHGDAEPAERVVLTLNPQTHSLASEWLDGLLMLLNQAPITAETARLVAFATDYGLKIRLLNMRVDDEVAGPVQGMGVVPSREGLDEDYYYEV